LLALDKVYLLKTIILEAFLCTINVFVSFILGSN